MEKHTFLKRAIAFIWHQLSIIFVVAGAFAADYYMNINEITSYVLYGLVAFSFVVAFVTVGYLASAISTFHLFDKVGADVQVIIFLLISYGVIELVLPINPEYGLVDRLIVVSVFTYVVDFVFLLIMSSVVTQYKDGILLKTMLWHRLGSHMSEILFEHTMFTRALRGFIAWIIGIVGVAIFFTKHSWWGIALLVLSGGIELFFSLQKAAEEKRIRKAILEITEGNLDGNLDEESFHGEQKKTAEAVNHIRDGLEAAVRVGIKNERMKADLITNVSHDLKTPLTSIINYTDLLQRENLDSDTAQKHILILSEKAHRMRVLLEDLVEVSRLTSGNVSYQMSRIDFVELLYEIGGEFDDRFEQRGLTIVTKLSRLPVYIEADGRQLCRAVENLYTNAAKYAKENTAVHVELHGLDNVAEFTIKNVMEHPLENQTAKEDLMDRFVRGDRSRTTEGSGLGLSITKELVTQMGGSFAITVEEDMYCASITFKIP